MDFQELSALWNSNDQELDRQIEIRQRLVKEVGIYKVRTYLSEIKWTAYFELAISLIFLPFIGRYLADTFSETKFFLPGLLLFAFLIFSVGISSYQLTLYYGIRAGYSVVQTQLKVARLKYMELLDVNLLLIIIPLFFAPFMIVMAKALANYDLYRHSQWLISSTLGSVVVALVVVFFLRQFPNERLQEAQDFLNDLKEEE